MTTNPPDKEWNAYLYSRVSSGAQTRGSGLTRQDERGAALCKQMGWRLVDDALSDVGSAYSGENILKGNLGRFMVAAKERRLKSNPLLVLEQWDRFSRQELDSSFDLARDLLKCGVGIYIGFGGGKLFTAADLNNMASRVAMEISMQQAWEYSHNLSNRVNKAFQNKYVLAAAGKPVQLGAWQPLWIDFVGENKQVGKFITNAKASIIMGIVAEYLSGKSMAAIAQQLNRDRVPCIGKKTKCGRQWTQGQVGPLLRSEALIGTIAITQHRFENYYPALISKSQWRLLQNKLDTNLAKHGGTREGDWISSLFPNRVRCSCCGGSVSTHNNKSGTKIQRYYKCSVSRHSPDKCDVREMLPIHQIEEDFFMLFLEEHPMALLGKRAAKVTVEMDTIKARIAEIDKTTDELLDLILKVPGTAAKVQSRLAALSKERTERERAIETANARLFSTAAAPVAFQNIQKTLKALRNAPTLSTDGKEVKAVVKAIGQLREQLGNNEVRKKLVGLLPSLVSTVEVDFRKRSYRIVNHADEKSEWRKLA